MSSREVLQKVINEQEAQIVNYEKKLKDVVRAYKSIESEKKALEVALSVLSSSTADPNTSLTITTDEEETNNKTDLTEEKNDQLEALKQAISTLTIENKKKEIAFQIDRKSLLSTKEKLTEEIERLKVANNNSEAERRLREQLAEVEAQREKILSDHGSVVAEMQQRYAKEHKHAETMENQVTQLSHRLQEKDDQIQALDARIREFARMEQEVQKLRKKAEANPTAQVLKQELLNVKERYEDELSAVRNRHAINSTLLSEKDARICALEERINCLSEEGASMNMENAELRLKLENRSEKIYDLNDEDQKSMQNTEGKLEPKSLQVLEEEIREACRELKSRNLSSNFLVLLSEFLPSEFSHKAFSICPAIDDCDAGKPENENATNTRAHNSLESRDNKENCDLCDVAQREAANFKSQIYELQCKLHLLEEMHGSVKDEHEQTSEALRKRITELEASQQRAYFQLSSECMEKVNEMEEELKRQQIRMREIIEDKDKEIEYARSSLTALCAKNYGMGKNGQIRAFADPLDPKPRTFDGELRQICSLELSENDEYKENFKSYFDSSEDPSSSNYYDSATSTSHRRSGACSHQSSIEARNVFYEQELGKRQQEISELRNMVRLSELKVRDIEQAMLTKDIQYLQIVETLKEEIRILEGKLSLERSETNLAEYLRNIFVQFINSSNTRSRKHILKAIGAVLKLTITEMKKVESWNL